MNVRWSIVPATPAHAAGIGGVCESARGSLVHLLSAEQVADRLQSPLTYCLVALDESQQVIGFLWNVRTNCEPRPAMFLEQIAVLPEWRGRGVAAALYDAMIEQSRPRLLECTILHKPVENTRSRAFFERRKWRFLHEKRDQTYTWGVYEWRESECPDSSS